MRRKGDHCGLKLGVQKSKTSSKSVAITSRHKDKIKDRLVREARRLEKKYRGKNRVARVR